MSAQSIDEQIKTFYLQRSLSDEALERLRNLARKPAKPERSSLRIWQTVALAATVALAFLAGVLFVVERPASQPVTPSVASVDMSNKIAGEVALRHEQCQHTDFTAPELEALAAKMSNLDFDVAAPAGVDLSTLKLKGGHYCVVNGQLALHANFIDENGRSISLLETKATQALASIRHAMREVDDVEVEMWQKDGVVMALARPVA